MTWFQRLKRECTLLHDKAMYKGRREYPCCFSRGRQIKAMKDGELLDDGNFWEWDGTLKGIERAAESLRADGADVLFIECGYDGAESPHGYRECDDYEPWIEVWDVEFWSREKGFDHFRSSDDE